MAAKYWFAADYTNPLPQLQEAGVPVCREFAIPVNSNGGTLNGQSIVSSLATTAPDTLCLTTIPGQGYGVEILDYYLDIDKVDAGGGSAALVLEMGLLLTSTTNAAATSSLDAGATTAASASLFFTLLTPGNAAVRGDMKAFYTNAATPVIVPITYPIGIIPYPITNLSGFNSVSGIVATYPNSGLYDLCLTVTTSANTVTTTTKFIRGWVKYKTLGAAYQG